MKIRKMPFLLIFFFILLAGCKKIKKLTQFNMDYDASIVVPASSGINLPFNLFTPDVESNSASTFEVNDTRKDLVNEIKLTHLDLTLTSPSNGDLGFLKSIKLYISADGLPEKEIAWKENISSTVGKYLELETTKSDLKAYIKKDKFKLRVNTVTDQALGVDHHIDVHSTFFVDAKIF